MRAGLCNVLCLCGSSGVGMLADDDLLLLMLLSDVCSCW